MSKIKLSAVHISGNEVPYIMRAVEKGEVSNYGENIDAFELQLEQYLVNNSKIALLNSGTAAIHLALIHLGVKSNDEVICQSFTFSASANPIVYLGAIPIFVDSEFDTWNMCPIYLEEAIKDRVLKGKKPKAIIVVHSYGMPAKMDELTAISLKYNIPIIEDAAEALGAMYKGQKCGTFGQYGILSFNGNKMITTSGGGALICKSKGVKEKIYFLSSQAKDDKPYYHHTEIGYNYKMSNILAGIGRAQMETLNHYIELRRQTNQFYTDLFENIKGVEVLKELNGNFYSNHWLSCIIIEEYEAGFSNEELRLELLSHHIESKLLWKPLHKQPVFKNDPYYGNNTSETLFKNGLALPSGSSLTEEEKHRIKAIILAFVNNNQVFEKTSN